MPATRYSLATLRDSIEPLPDDAQVPVGWIEEELAEGEDEEENSRLLTTSEAANKLSVRPRTVAKWCREDRLPNALKTGEDGDGEWRIPKGDVDAGPADTQGAKDERVRFHRTGERTA